MLKIDLYELLQFLYCSDHYFQLEINLYFTSWIKNSIKEDHDNINDPFKCEEITYKSDDFLSDDFLSEDFLSEEVIASGSVNPNEIQTLDNESIFIQSNDIKCDILNPDNYEMTYSPIIPQNMNSPIMIKDTPDYTKEFLESKQEKLYRKLSNLSFFSKNRSSPILERKKLTTENNIIDLTELEDIQSNLFFANTFQIEKSPEMNIKQIEKSLEITGLYSFTE